MNQNLQSFFIKKSTRVNHMWGAPGGDFTFSDIKKGSTKIIPKIRVFFKCRFHRRALTSHIRARSCHHEDLGQPLAAQGLP
jgi:hypothetical protein